MSAVVRVIDLLGMLGLILRGDPPRTIDMTDRVWGAAVQGFALSLREIPRDDSEQLAAVSAVMKNTGNETLNFVFPGWMHFYAVQIAASQTPYGRSLLRPERSKERLEISVGPGDATETDIPVGSFYELKAKTEYVVSVTCALPDGTALRSNEIRLKA